MKVKIEGMKELQKSLRKVENLPTKTVSKAARKGMKISKASSKQGGWIDQTGTLRRGIILKAEKSKVKGKKVFEVTLDKKYNNEFQKTTSTGKVIDNKTGKSKNGVYYYPASQEHGFRTRNGGWVPGFHYLEHGLTENKQLIEKTIVSEMSIQLDKLLE